MQLSPIAQGLLPLVVSDLWIVLCSVYMPYDDGTQDHVLQVEQMTGFMQSILDQCLGAKFVFAGNFNVEKHVANNK